MFIFVFNMYLLVSGNLCYFRVKFLEINVEGSGICVGMLVCERKRESKCYLKCFVLEV